MAFTSQASLWSILNVPACGLCEMDDGIKFPCCMVSDYLERENIHVQLYFNKHRHSILWVIHFLLHYWLAWPVLSPQISCKYSYTPENILPDWNICLLICGACLELKVWMKMKNSSFLDAINIPRTNAVYLKSDRQNQCLIFSNLYTNWLIWFYLYLVPLLVN